MIAPVQVGVVLFHRCLSLLVDMYIRKAKVINDEIDLVNNVGLIRASFGHALSQFFNGLLMLRG